MDTLLADIRLAVRALRRSPGFATAAIGVLALGIAANTAVFSVADAVLFRPLPYNQPEQLVLINEVVPRFSRLYPYLPVNSRHFEAWQSHARSFSGMTILRDNGINLTGNDGPPERLGIENVSANVLAVLRVQPLLGRNFTPEEDRPGNNRVVITEPLWRRRFHSDPTIVNKSILLNGVPNQVIGILPADFWFPRPDMLAGLGTSALPVQILRPAAIDNKHEGADGDYNYTVIARLRNGVTVQQAMAELNSVESALNRELKIESDPRIVITPMQDRIVSGSRRGLLVLLGSIGAVLLIVCVNIGNLMLARTTARAREMAIRTALGAGAWRIVRQVVTESLVISLAGGLLGIGLAYAAVQALVAAAPIDVPRLDEVHIDVRVLLFAMAVSVAAGLLFGLIPSWRASRAEPQQTLPTGGRGSTQGHHTIRLSELLVSAEVALSAALLVAAGLLVGSLMRIFAADQGFHPDNVLTVGLNLSSAKYRELQQRTDFIDRLLRSVRTLPGVRAAGSVSWLPLQGETWVDMITREDDHRPMWERPAANYRAVSPGYFAAMEIPILRGRPFEESDREHNTVIVSARTAAALWPGENPIGKRIRRGLDEEPFSEIIGVVGDTRTDMKGEPPLIVYRTYWHAGNSMATNLALAIRSAQDPVSLAAAVRAAVWSLDAEMPVPEMRSMRQLISASVAQRRFQAILLGGFAVSALLLAIIGIYGVISYSITRRRNEIGIRMALGAQAHDVKAMVLRQGMRPVALGLLCGLAMALVLGRVLSSLLYEIQPSNPIVLALVAFTLGAAAALACYLPARRAAAVDPSTVLRYE
ncbi:MAG TPA: ABC transporter permease [Bryobacteraceae bacterium]|nr:ABC transporter permease [Bryobacteraceae bacterium]